MNRIERWLMSGMISLSACLMLIFSTGPIFEGPDEIEHYRYIRTMARTHALPDAYGQPRSEYHQPPLYYVFNLPIALLIEDDDFEAIEARLNPYYGAWIDVPGNDNKNIYLHTRDESFPYTHSNTALAVHLMRLVSILIGIGTLVICTAIFRHLWPDHPTPRLLALGLVAFWPQFLYLSGIVSNDNLVVCLTTLTLWLLLRVTRDGLTRRNTLWLGLTLGAMLLTEVSTLFVGLPVMLVLLYALARDHRAWKQILLIGALVLLIAGWWYLRNAILYSDPTNTQAVIVNWKTEAIRDHELALDIGLERIPFVYETLWARFGQGAVASAPWIYTFYDIVVIATLVGLVIGLLTTLRRPHPRVTIMQGSLIILYGVIWICAVFYWSSTVWSGNQGRFLLPAVAAWGVMAGFGLDHLLITRPNRTAGTFIAILAFAIVATASLFISFLPSYRVLPVPEHIARPLDYRYEDTAQLLGMTPANPRARPGETIQITLYWRALRPGSPTLQAYLHSAGSDVVRRDSLPATGNLLASDWKAGETWAERYVVEIPPDAPPQTVYPLLAGLYNPARKEALEATNAEGEVVSPMIGRIAINGPKHSLDPDYRFGTSIGLTQPDLTWQDGRIEACFQWESLAETAVDYTVFVHVLDETGQQIGQVDAQPRHGDYPTGAWAAGEIISDCLMVDVPSPPGPDWQVAIGFYRFDAEGQAVRLPVTDSNGVRIPHDSVTVPMNNVGLVRERD